MEVEDGPQKMEIVFVDGQACRIGKTGVNL
jgi:hypothetical protein